jgi:hypothetical protein
MTIHDKIAIFWIIVSVLLILSIVFRTIKTQKGANLRLQTIREDSKVQFQEAIDVSNKQLEVLKEILVEIKTLRACCENITGR